jgi:hypothetical protein
MGQMPDTDTIDDFSIHPKGGPYGFTIKKCTDVDESGTPLVRDSDGQPYAFIELNPDSDVTSEGEVRGLVFHRFTLTDKFLFLIKRFRVALGRPDGPLNWEDLVGMRVNVYIEHNGKGGKTYANVANWEPYKDSTPQTQPKSTNPVANGDDLPF